VSENRVLRRRFGNEMNEDGTSEDDINRSFVICVPRQKLLVRSYEGG
jgi:hypothetical protein